MNPAKTTVAKTPISIDHSYIAKLPTFAERGSAIAKRLEDIKANPKYQALPEDRKTKVRADLYNKLVPASYAGFKLPVPDKETWVAASGRDVTMNGKPISQTFEKTKAEGGRSDYWRRNTESFQDIETGFKSSANSMYMFGLKATNAMVNDIFGLAEHFTHTPHAEMQKLYNQFDTPKVLATQIAATKARMQNYDYWLQTHPRDTVVGRLDSKLGEALATLPLYEAIDTGMLAKAGVSRFAPSLTTKLAASKTGTFVAKRLMNASDGFLTSLVTSGGNTSEAKAGAVGFAIGAPVLEGGGKLGGAAITKIASAPLIKKWTANVIAMGGKPFAEELSQSSWHELSPMAWWLQYGKEWGVKSAHAAVDGTRLGPELMMFPEAEGKGHFVSGNKVYRYATRETQQRIFDQLTKESHEIRAVKDPVMAKLHEAEKASMESIALAKFGKKNAELSNEQRITVANVRMTQIREAAEEAPSHLPEDVKQEVGQQIQAARVQNPELNATMKQFEQKYGINFPEAQAENIISRNEEKTGIKNAAVAGRKLAKTSALTDGAVIDTKTYASLRTDTMSYLRAPRNREQLVEALGPVAHENWAKFYDTLKAHDSSKLQYEKPEHRLLYLYPDLIAKKDAQSRYLARAIERRLKQTTEFNSSANSEILEQAKRLHNHVYELARSGRLSVGANIYRSTLLDGSHTKWQTQLSDETFQEVVRASEIALRRHPLQLKVFKTIATGLQRDIKVAATANEAAELQHQLEDFSNKMLTSHAQIK